MLCCDAVYGGGVQEGTMALVQLSAGFQSLPLLPTSKLATSHADSRVGGFVYVLGHWVFPKNSPVRLGVFPTTASPIGFYSQRF